VSEHWRRSLCRPLVGGDLHRSWHHSRPSLRHFRCPQTIPFRSLHLVSHCLRHDCMLDYQTQLQAGWHVALLATEAVGGKASIPRSNAFDPRRLGNQPKLVPPPRIQGRTHRSSSLESSPADSPTLPESRICRVPRLRAGHRLCFLRALVSLVRSGCTAELESRQ